MDRTCRVCDRLSAGGAARVRALAEALTAGEPVCHIHTLGPANVVVTAAREGLAGNATGVVAACRPLYEQLLDPTSTAHKRFTRAYPAGLRPRAVDQAAGILGTVLAVAAWRAGDTADAVRLGADAAGRLGRAVGVVEAGRLSPNGDPELAAFWSRVADGGPPTDLAPFQWLTVVLTGAAPPAGRPVTVRLLVHDPSARGVLARVEATPTPAGGAVVVDVSALGFRVLDDDFRRAVRAAADRTAADLARVPGGGAGAVLRFPIRTDGRPHHAFHGGSAGLGVGCALRAVARADVLDEDTPVTGELDPAGGEAVWPGFVHEKLTAVRAVGVRRAVVGVTGEGVRHPGRLADWADPGLTVVGAATRDAAYDALRPVPMPRASVLRSAAERDRHLDAWVRPLLAARRLDDAAMRRLFTGYWVLHEEHAYDDAVALADGFAALLAANRIEVPDAQHREALAALRYGLPREPVHLHPYREVSVEQLLTLPDYPALLRAIRASEIDPPRAVREFEQLAGRLTVSRSPFCYYPWGLALRKMERLPEAYEKLRTADSLIRAEPDKYPGAIRLEVLRGLAAVCRKRAKAAYDRAVGGPLPPDYRAWRDRAHKCLRRAVRLAAAQASPSRPVLADLYHTYGYFHLQFGHLDYLRTGDQAAYQAALRRAAGKFRRSVEYDPEWGASDARLQLVRHKLLQLGEPVDPDRLADGYDRARGKTGYEQDQGAPESGLTRVLCSCGLVLLGPPQAPRVTAGRAYEDLVEALCRQVKSPGAIDCHSFDLDFLTYGLDAHPVADTAALLGRATAWGSRGYAEFVLGTARDRLAAGSLSADAARGWCQTAARLIDTAAHDDPTDPAVARLKGAIAALTAPAAPAARAVRPLRVGVIGCGEQCLNYYMPYLTDRVATRADLAVGWLSGYLPDDLWVGRIAAAAAALGCDHLPGDGWRDRLGEVDTVVVSLPNALHGPAIRAALAAGKHVAVDKPTTVCPDEADELAETAKAKELVFVTLSQRRYEEVYQAVAELVRTGKVGRPQLVRYMLTHCRLPPGWTGSRRLAGGGALLQTGYHGLDTLLWLLAQTPAEHGGPIRVAGVSAACGYDDPADPDRVESLASVRMRLTGGGVFELTAGHTNPAGSLDEAFEIVGTGGMVRFRRERHVRDDRAGVLSFQDAGGTVRAYNTSGWAGDRPAPLRDFVDAVLRQRAGGDGRVLSPAADSVATLRAVRAAYRSAAAGGQELPPDGRPQPVHHVAVQTAHFEPALRFYRDLLGMEVLEDRPFKQRRVAWLRAGGTRVELFSNRAGEELAGWSDYYSGPVHLAFQVDDLDRFLAWAKGQGAELHPSHPEPFVPPVPGAKPIAYLLGPDGEEVEVREAD